MRQEVGESGLRPLSVVACSMWLMEMEPEPEMETETETETRRRGLFWDVQAGRVPPPPAATLLGWELVRADPERGTIEVAFHAGDQFTNPVGVIQGGFLAAMLDDTLGPALVASLPENQFAPTLDLHVQFLRPARPGRLVGRGRVVQRGKEVCFLAGELVDPEGKTVAVATATARIQTVRR
ncbi:PaaI family thioesterase [Streptomyces spongiicola]|uniref:PaaI family thioesterase n=1 Tax=Streptomyces spongiicola TaxID=1690221 RepID=UPI001FEA1C07|nr:PaaI family thioesterase [Streptomyces spongiicola]